MELFSQQQYPLTYQLFQSQNLLYHLNLLSPFRSGLISSPLYNESVRHVLRIWICPDREARGFIILEISYIKMINMVKIDIIKVGQLRMYIEEREQCRAVTRHRPWSWEPFTDVAVDLEMWCTSPFRRGRCIGTASCFFWDIFLSGF